MTIGETFLSAFLQVLFEKLLSPGVILFSKLWGGDDLGKTIKLWKRQLKMMEALLDDADQKQYHSKAVKTWLEEFQDLAYDMEDILDDFAYEAQLHELRNSEEDDDCDTNHPGFLGSASNMVQNITDGLSNLFNVSNPGSIQSRIDDLTERLQDLQSQNLGLVAAHTMQQSTLQTEALRSRRESTSLVGEPVVFGRDDIKKDFITLLLKDEPSYEKFVVMPIVGRGGIGKTTLAQCVYNDEQVQSHFNLKAWVCVSDVFDVKRITTEIINSATHSKVDFSTLNLAQEKLMQVLSGKTFFIVLDDIWSENYDDWSLLQIPFRYGVKGSRIVMTTRIEKIAKMMFTNNSTSITLEGLSNDDCWRLFQQHTNEDTGLAEMKDLIVRKCNGLPLAAKTLGGLLKSITEKSQRWKILESNVWGDESSVLTVMRLSYFHLPSYLKRVFAYCSVLPKDYVFSEREVVLLWMAQGFLPDNQSESMESIGHNYFLDLVSRSLFEQSPNGGGAFIMHDIVHDLAQLAAGDVCFTMGMDIKKDLERTRHVFVTRAVFPESQLKYPQLRTFHSKHSLNAEQSVQKFRYLRTLVLRSNNIKVLPMSVGDLIHLRLLYIVSIALKELPQSISNLLNLQTLYFKDCYMLEKIPRIRFWGKLRHLILTDTRLKEMPLGMGKLKNLQTLDEFVLAAGGGSRIRQLKNLNQLRGSIRISGLRNVIKVEDAREAQLHEKRSIDELHLYWNTIKDEVIDYITERDVAEHLQPHTSVKKCKLNAYFGSAFPSWLGHPSFKHMVDIKLKNCAKCECLPPLGQLPLLENLKVVGMNGIKEVGPEFYGRCSIPFQALKTLCLEGMESWKRWVHSPVDNSGEFPCLESLTIKNCKALKGDLPPLCPCLKTLKISDCNKMSVSIGSLPLLEYLRVKRCRVLSVSGDVIFCSTVVLEYISKITSLPGHFPNLREKLIIDHCEFPSSTISQIPAVLKTLEIIHCKGVQSLEFENSYSLTPCLETFSVEFCGSLVSIGNIPIMLGRLNIVECVKLRVVEFNKIPKGINGNDEKTLSIDEGVGLSLKASLELPLLTELSVDCHSLLALQEDLLFPALKRLWFYNCRNVERLPCELHNLTSLSHLVIDNCPTMNVCLEGGLPRNLTTLSLPSSLAVLEIQDFQNLQIISNNTLPNLAEISIRSCPKFESLDGDFTSLTKLVLGKCPLLRSIPRGLPRCLKVLSIYETNIEGLTQEWGLHLLTSLEDLKLENVGSCSDSVECISNLLLPSSLRKLSIKGFRNLAIISCSTLPNLEYLHFESCPKLESLDGDEDEDSLDRRTSGDKDDDNLDRGTSGDEVDDITEREVVEHLQPHTSIEKYELKGYMGSAFPSWLGDPSFTYIVDIRLENCEKCECLPPLGQLPLLENLEVVGLNGIKEVGLEFYGRCSIPFLALKTLCLDGMNSWKRWVHSPVDDSGAFPCLESLTIKNCNALQGDLPPLCTCLKTLEINSCEKMSVSLPSLPLLEDLWVESCKVLSISGDVIFCSKRVVLKHILEITALPWRFPNLGEELTIDSCTPSPITIDQIPVVLRQLKIHDCEGLQSLEFETSSSLTPCLENFWVSECGSLVSIGNIPTMLQSLEIFSCDKLRIVEFNEIPKSMSGNSEKTLRTDEGVGLSPEASLELPLLKRMSVTFCDDLIALREGLLLPALNSLKFYDCTKMERLPCELHNLISLQHLDIQCCPTINPTILSLPSSLSVLHLDNLENLQIINSNSTLPNLTQISIYDCPKLESLDGDFTSLTRLTVYECPLLRSFAERGLPRSLTPLSICETNIEVLIQEWGLHLLTSLEDLTLLNVGSCSDSVECISNLLLPSSLSTLYMRGFRNLKTISLSTLPNLTKISIEWSQWPPSRPCSENINIGIR